MAVRSEQINIIYNTIYKKTGVEQLEVAQKRIHSTINKMSAETGIALNRVYGGLERANVGFDRSGRLIDMVSQKSVKYSDAQNRLTQSSSRFKMEWLGLIFAGMSLERVFGGYINQTNEMIGTTDVWNMTMTLLTLGPLLDVQTGVLAISNALLGLPEPIQYAMGVFMIATTAAGTAIASVSQAVMGLASLKLAFPGFYAANITPLLTQLQAIPGAFAAMGPAGWAAATALAAAALIVITEWDKVQASLSEFGEYMRTGMQGDMTEAQKHLDDSVELMGLAFREFFEVKLPLMVFAGVKAAAMPLLWFIETVAGVIGRLTLPGVLAGMGKGGEVAWNAGLDWLNDKVRTGISAIPLPDVTKSVADIEARRGAIMGNVTFSPNITVNATSNVDVDRMKNQLTSEWYKDLQNMTRK